MSSILLIAETSLTIHVRKREKLYAKAELFSAMVVLIVVLIMTINGVVGVGAQANPSSDDNNGVDRNGQSFPELIIYSNEYPPHAYFDQDGRLVGEATETVREFLNTTGLSYEFQILPWARAFREATVRDNALIYSLNRTPEREHEFNWLIPLNTSVFYLFVREEAKFSGMTREDVLSANGKAVCEQDSSLCTTLREFGFSEERIWELSSKGHPSLTALVQRGRADFIVSELAVIESENLSSDEPSMNLVPLFPVNSVTDYLATHRSIDADLLKKLNEAAQDYLASKRQ